MAEYAVKRGGKAYMLLCDNTMRDDKNKTRRNMMAMDSFDEEISAALKLKEYCRDQGYALTGDYICEELTEFNVFDMHRRNMFLRLQIPVKFQKNA